MPTFTETKTLKSIKLVPELDIIITEHEVATLKDGTVVNKATEGRSYSNFDIADFEMTIAPTGGTLLEIVESFNSAAQVAKTEALAALKTAQDALQASEAKVASLQAQIDAYTPPVPTIDVTRIEALNGLRVIEASGLAAAYTAWATSPDRTFLERAFIDKAVHWLRSDATLLSAAADLGLTTEQLDAMFAQAAAM